MSGTTKRIGVRAPLHAGFAFPSPSLVDQCSKHNAFAPAPKGQVMPRASLGRTGSLEPQQGIADCAKCDWKYTVIASGEHFVDVCNDLSFVLE